MDVRATDRSDHTVVEVMLERIDAAAAIAFKDSVRDLTRTSGRRYVLDLHRVDFVDSSGLGAIVACMKLLPEGSSLELAGLTRNVRKVFELTRMDSVFKIHPDAAAAAAA